MVYHSNQAYLPRPKVGFAETNTGVAKYGIMMKIRPFVTPRQSKKQKKMGASRPLKKYRDLGTMFFIDFYMVTPRSEDSEWVKKSPTMPSKSSLGLGADQHPKVPIVFAECIGLCKGDRGRPVPRGVN